jgi:hypothetical protein
LAFGSADSSLSIFEINTPFLSFLYYKQRQKRVNHIDGWGKLKLPNGFDYDVLRVKSEIYAVDTIHIDTTISVGGIPIPLNQGFNLPRPKSIEYKWLAKNKQAAILEVIGTENAGTFTPTTVRYYNQFPLGIAADFYVNFEVFPTVANDVLHFTDVKNISTIYIVDVDGKIIQKHHAAIKIDIQALPASRYFVVALANNKVVATKSFIKN